MNEQHRQSIGSMLHQFFAISSAGHSVNNEDFACMLDRIQEGVAIFDVDGEKVYQNKAISSMELPAGNLLKEQYQSSLTGTLRIPQNLTDSVSVHVVETPDGFGAFTEPTIDRLSIRDKTLQYLMKPVHSEENIYARAARALGLATGWRWVGVSKYLNEEGSDVRFHGWWDSAEVKEPFDLNTVGTACEVVAQSEEFCFFTGHNNLKERFPEMGLIEALSLESYAGLVYKIDGKPVGHIIAMNDGPLLDSEVMEDLLRLVAGFVGVQLELDSQADDVARNHRLARIDELTGLGNRLAFNETIHTLVEQFRLKQTEDVLIINVDLDGLKAVNDNDGHAAGDDLIKAYSEILRKLWRPADHFFRHGGDEFSLLIAGIDASKMDLINERMQLGNDNLRQVSMEKSGASFGLCFLSETNGDHEEAWRIADARMYEVKRASKEA